MAAALAVVGGWALVAARRREAAYAGGIVDAAQPATGLVTLPLRQRIKGWFVRDVPRVKGPGLWRRLRFIMAARGGQNGRSSAKLGLMDRFRTSDLANKVRRSETAISWRARRQARIVQRRIKDRRSGG